MYNFYKYIIIPEERFNNTKNPRVYINRFQELAKKSFYFDNDRLYYVKSYSCKRLEDGSFEDKNKIDNIEVITKEYCSQCPECYTKFYSRKFIKTPIIIHDEGPHYRLLIDITYLDENYYKDKTEYKYIIDCIDHFTKFYWGYLIRDKTAKTALNKIKNFIAINKKPVIIQTDNGL